MKNTLMVMLLTVLMAISIITMLWLGTSLKRDADNYFMDAGNKAFENVVQDKIDWIENHDGDVHNVKYEYSSKGNIKAVTIVATDVNDRAFEFYYDGNLKGDFVVESIN